MSVSVENLLPLPYRIVGSRKETVYKVTFDSSYAEGGEALTASQLGLNAVESAQSVLLNGTEASEKWVGAPSYTASTAKIHLQDLKTGKELAAETNCEKVTVQITSRGS